MYIYSIYIYHIHIYIYIKIYIHILLFCMSCKRSGVAQPGREPATTQKAVTDTDSALSCLRRWQQCPWSRGEGRGGEERGLYKNYRNYIKN